MFIFCMIRNFAASVNLYLFLNNRFLNIIISIDIEYGFRFRFRFK